MKTIKKIAVGILAVFAFSLLAGYFYFDRKFTPEENTLILKNESGKIPIQWVDESKSVLLLPIHFKGDSVTYYLQWDTGSPSTVFYKKAIQKIPKIQIQDHVAKCLFTIGNTEIQSEKIKILDFGKENDTARFKIIGTLGADVLEHRKTILNFKDNTIELNLKTIPSYFRGKTFGFELKKRKIIIPALLNGKEEKYLYDSGSSAYELLTNQENWEELKTPNAKIEKEHGNSWGNILTTYTATSENKIDFGGTKIPLNKVTYVEGYSKTQYLLMKFSGMSGMLGKALFLNNEIFIDAEHLEMGIR